MKIKGRWHLAAKGEGVCLCGLRVPKKLPPQDEKNNKDACRACHYHLLNLYHELRREYNLLSLSNAYLKMQLGNFVKQAKKKRKGKSDDA